VNAGLTAFLKGDKGRPVIFPELHELLISTQECKPVQAAPVVKDALKFVSSSLPSIIEIRQSIEGFECHC
jgi:hypothetical protein